jgi:MYXO-CTERM domain-containing protein
MVGAGMQVGDDRSLGAPRFPGVVAPSATPDDTENPDADRAPTGGAPAPALSCAGHGAPTTATPPAAAWLTVMMLALARRKRRL